MMKDVNQPLGTDESGDACAVSISALMDGALAGRDADAALTAAAQPEGQERWQLYHLIGDTLRAADLAAHHDAALLAGVRAAIRQPAPLESALLPAVTEQHAANDGVFRWKLAAGFASVLAVAAIGWNLWGWANTGALHGQQLAQAQPVAQPMAQVAPSQAVEPASLQAAAATDSAAAPEDVQSLALNAGGDQAPILRDPQLDRLLVAHRRMAAFGDSTSAFLRDATYEEPPH